MPKMHQNTLGGRTPSGPAGGAYALPRHQVEIFYATHVYDVTFTKLVRVCPAVISLTALSHRIFKDKTIVT